MKLQQSLICAIVVGISSGAGMTSCQNSRIKSQPDKVQTNKSTDKKVEPSPKRDNCPTCGMG